MTKEKLYKKFLLETKQDKAFKAFETSQKFVGKKLYVLKSSNISEEVTVLSANYNNYFNDVILKVSGLSKYSEYTILVKNIDKDQTWSTEKLALEAACNNLKKDVIKYNKWSLEAKAHIETIKDYLRDKGGK